jgi:hypothetical protein
MLESIAAREAPRSTPDGVLLEWQEVRSSGALLAVYRAHVPGGWLVYASNGYHHHGGITFYPDPTHAWANDAQL